MQFLLSQCHSAFTTHPHILITLFLAGLLGGMTHCAGMCGPFVLAQLPGQPRGETMLKRLRGAALLPYHLGRMTTYTAMGVVAASLSRQIIGTPVQQWIAATMLSLAGAVFILSALPQMKRRVMGVRHRFSAQAGVQLGKLARGLFRQPQGFHGYGLGVLLGFLPCGLIFAALMVVSATASPWAAALGMIVFTLATLPALLLVGVGGQWARQHWPKAMQPIVRVVMIGNGVSLLSLAGHMVM